MPMATVGPYELHYVEAGEGLAVLLIHGLAGDLSAWRPQIDALRATYRVVAFDNRGARRSTQVDEPVTTLDLARDTLQLLDVLGIERAHVGRSMGGAIAQHMTLLEPDRVQSLALYASFAPAGPAGSAGADPCDTSLSGPRAGASTRSTPSGTSCRHGSSTTARRGWRGSCR